MLSIPDYFSVKAGDEATVIITRIEDISFRLHTEQDTELSLLKAVLTYIQQEKVNSLLLQGHAVPELILEYVPDYKSRFHQYDFTQSPLLRLIPPESSPRPHRAEIIPPISGVGIDNDYLLSVDAQHNLIFTDSHFNLRFSVAPEEADSLIKALFEAVANSELRTPAVTLAKILDLEYLFFRSREQQH